jgi:hypothetical protein
VATRLRPLCGLVLVLALGRVDWLLAQGSGAAPQPASAELLEGLTTLDVTPAEVELSSSRGTRQVLVRGTYRDGTTRDLTLFATWQPADAAIAEVARGRVVARGEGDMRLAVRVGDLTREIAVRVRGFAQPDPVGFRTEVLPVLTRHGCNAGSCHGAPEGKGGFALSMLAYAPDRDEESLRNGGLVRRIEPIDPESSLLLRKPLLALPHVGGKRFRETDPGYALLRDWIAEGARPDPTPVPDCTGIEIEPRGAVLLRAGTGQQLSVLARFRDGSTRDVTALATYDTSNRDLATGDPTGHIRGHRRGVAAISVRYLQHLQSVPLTIVEPVAGFEPAPLPTTHELDRLIQQQLNLLGIPAASRCNDATFLRRVSLDVTGLLPSVPQVREFLADPSPDKRDRMIDRLLASEEFARFWGQKEADLLRVNAGAMPEGRAEALARWIVEAWRTNQPFDQHVRQLLTAVGPAREQPAVNLFLAIPANEDLAESTAQLFMGSRINCAKCHNHPFENWTQDDYYRIAAVFARLRRDGQTLRLHDQGDVRHPATGAVMSPWGAPPAPQAPAADRREDFVTWLTAPGNPLFARVEVNRLWAQLLGRGIVHPVDDFRSSNPPANPALLDWLADQFVRSGFDRRALLRLILTSDTYQRSSETTPLNEEDDRQFSHALVRRLSAEQVQDAIGLATRSLPSLADIARDQQQTAESLARREQEVRSGTPEWITQQRAKLADLRLRLGVWRHRGPFHVSSYAEGLKNSFPPETETFEKTPLTGDSHPEWPEAKAQQVGDGRVAVHYIARTLHAREAGKAMLFLGSDDGVKVWLNGQVVLDKPDTRGVKENDDTLPLELVAGDNRLLLKITNSGGFCGFYFRLGSFQEQPVPTPELALDLAEELAAQAGDIPESLQQRLQQERERQDRDLLALRDTLQKITRREAYQTQRLVPAGGDFLRAFGQPRRETPCVCERVNEPAIDQVLHLLNGGQVLPQITHAAGQYDAIADNGALVDELYLAILSRFPRETERQPILAHLQKASARRLALEDVIWALLNTREFLVAH